MSIGDHAMTTMPSIVLVEDDPAARASFEMLLDAEGFAVRSYADAETMLADDAAAGAACVLSDLRLGDGMDGVDLVQALRRKGLAVPVVVITGHGDVPQAVRAMQAGARDFLEKPVQPDQLIEAIRRAIEQGSLPNRPAHPVPEALPRLERLAPREREVMRALIAGHANKVVAYQLGISPRTVETHRASIMDKLQIGSFAEMVRIGLAAGILDDEASGG